MTDCPSRTASCDPALQARIVRRVPLVYAEGPSKSDDRPPFVLAASGLATLGEYLFVVQDNANWLAIVHPDETVTAVPLPPGPHGERVFSKSRHNTDQKVDLEACVIMEGPDGPELVAFGSGTGESSCWILQVARPDLAASAGTRAGGLEARFHDAGPFYRSLRANRAFCGGRLNIEGAIALDEERIMVLQRGNAKPDEGDAVDATAEIHWPALRAHLHDPSAVAPPPVEKVTPYDLGQLDGVRLTFSDAEHLRGGRILYSASAEDGGSGDVAGSVLGIIDPAERTARWGQVLCEDGTPFTSKIEGLTIVPGEARRVRFVIDDDDENAPSEIFEAELSEGFGLS